jgi:hypothetical protein
MKSNLTRPLYGSITHLNNALAGNLIFLEFERIIVIDVTGK